MAFKISSRSYFWLRIISVVILIIGAIQVFNVNSPEPVVEKATPVKYTSGTLVEGRVEIPAGEFLSYEIKLNKRASLNGKFATEKLKGTVGCLMLNAENFVRWRDGGDFKAVAKTGIIPGGNLYTRLEPGDYYLVLDNRHSKNEPVFVNANFTVE
jgi:hypothetical protein